MPKPRKIGPTGDDTGKGNVGTLHPRGAEMTPDPHSWLDQAACLGSDPHIFFDDTADSNTKAKTICARCPVQAECLEDGRRSDATLGAYGVRAGLTVEERYQSNVRACRNCGGVFHSRRRAFCDKAECRAASQRRERV